MEHNTSIRKSYHRFCIGLCAAALLLPPSGAIRAEEKSDNGKTTLNMKVSATVYPLAVFTEEDCLGDTPKEECTTVSALPEEPEKADRAEKITPHREYLKPQEE